MAQPNIEAALQHTDEAIEALYPDNDNLEAISDTDSGYSEAALSTASVTSSIFDYEEEHGRSYHAFRRGKYVSPLVYESVRHDARDYELLPNCLDKKSRLRTAESFAASWVAKLAVSH
jgi:hypothetical protein